MALLQVNFKPRPAVKPATRFRSDCLPAGLAPLARKPATTTFKTAAATLGLGTSFINIQVPAIQVAAVEGGNCLVGLRGVRHFDKGEAAGATGVAIGHDVDTVHVAVRLEQGANRGFSCREIQVSHEDVFQELLSLSVFQLCGPEP